MTISQTAAPSVSSGIELSAVQKKRLADFNNPIKLWFWLLWKLPAAWFMGLRIKKLSAEKCEVTLPYAWRSQNPFQSIYFAAECAAAEFSTGALATLALAGRGKISMLVSHIETEFTKKATSLTTFTCEQGADVFEIVEQAIQTGEGQILTMVSTGRQANGEIVCVTRLTWRFKAKVS